MKRTLACLAVALLTWTSHAGTYYGAWWMTSVAERGAEKHAGSISIQLDENDADIVYWEREVFITARTSESSGVSVKGYWTQIKPGVIRIVVENTPGNIEYNGPRYVLTLKLLSGQITGNITAALFKAKVQATRIE